MKRSLAIGLSIGLCGLAQSLGCGDDSKPGVTLDASIVNAQPDAVASTVDAPVDAVASTVDAPVDAATSTVDAPEGADTQIVMEPSPPDYSDPAYWRRQSPLNGYGPEIREKSDAPMPADVFFVYPTTFFSAPSDLDHTAVADPKNKPLSWNQTFAQARVDPGIEAQVYSKTAVFAKAGTNLYVPFYRQAAGNYVLPALLWGQNDANRNAADNALAIAYYDVKLAFLHYLKVLNPKTSTGRRPFILAGHSQGSNLLLLLLQDNDFTPELRSQMVAAYVIGWSVTSDDIKGTQWTDHGICNDFKQTGCIVTYNTQQDPGDFSQAHYSPGIPNAGLPPTPPQGLVRRNAYSVNPLSWVANGPRDYETGFNTGIDNDKESRPADGALNLGARFFELNAVRPGNWTCAYDMRPQLGPMTSPLCASVPNDQVPCCAKLQAVPQAAPDTVVPAWSTASIAGWPVAYFDIAKFTGAQNNRGALVVNPNDFGGGSVGNYKNLNSPYNTNDDPTGVNAADPKNQPPGWYHNYDYSFFWKNLEQNVADRVQAFRAPASDAGR